jgi:hypothetical protein
MAMAERPRSNLNRRGSVYLAVLGTGLIVSLLAFSALALQRLQNRMLTASADIRQAQLNAEAAIELGLLAIKQDSDWRNAYANGTWFGSRNMGSGSCTLSVVDPVDGNLADDDTESIVMTGVGASGTAVQRVVRTFDPHAEALDCLRSSVAAGGGLSVSGAVLRATNSGLVSANTASATSSTVYGDVEATSISGSTYSGSTTQIAAADRPDMPDWSTVFDYYRTNGTEISVFNLDIPSTINLVYNNSFDDAIDCWSGDAPDWTNNVPAGASTLPDATIARAANFAGHSACLQVIRSSKRAGPLQCFDSVLRSGATYTISAQVYMSGSWTANMFRFGLYLQFADGSAVAVRSTPELAFNGLFPDWRNLTPVALTLPSWSGELRSAFLIVNSDDSSGNSGNFYLDNVQMYETSATGRTIYRTVLGPGVNPFGATTNSQGLYWINCGGNKVVINNARIKGTLLLVNPGAGSSVGPGPVHWSPVVAGYPALLVDAEIASTADVTIATGNHALGEAENCFNFNPSGASSDLFGQDQDTDELDIYPSEIQGLVVVRDDLTFQNNALVRGQVIAGDAITATSGGLEVVYRPDALFNPPPGFTATPSVVGRPLSLRKAVLP